MVHIQNAGIPAQNVTTIGVTPVKLVSALVGDIRTLFSGVNTSTGGQTITLGFGQPPTAGQGSTLFVGGDFTEALDAAFIPWSGEIWAVASASGATLAWQERHTLST